MIISIQETMGKCSLEREYPFSTRFVLFTNSCFIRYNTAWKICQCNSIDELVLLRVTDVLSTSDQLHYIWGPNCFGKCTQQYWDCLCQSWCLHILFFCDYILSISVKKILLWKEFFQCVVIAAVQVQSV